MAGLINRLSENNAIFVIIGKLINYPIINLYFLKYDIFFFNEVNKDSCKVYRWSGDIYVECAVGYACINILL